MISKGIFGNLCSLKPTKSSEEPNFNRGMSSKNTTGVKGVSFHQKSGRYRAYIKKDRKTKYLGSFKTIEEAAYAREQAAFSLFGEYTNRQAA